MMDNVFRDSDHPPPTHTRIDNSESHAHVCGVTMTEGDEVVTSPNLTNLAVGR